jgi:hypothetical protein
MRNTLAIHARARAMPGGFGEAGKELEWKSGARDILITTNHANPSVTRREI